MKSFSSYDNSEDEDYTPNVRRKRIYKDDYESDASSADSGVESYTTNSSRKTHRRHDRKDIVWLDEAMEINDKYFFT